MSNDRFGSVAALQYSEDPAMSFQDIVEEFDLSFQLVDNAKRRLTWDCDDIALLDRDRIRVGLAWVAPKHPDAPTYLVIAVGPLSRGSKAAPTPGFFATLTEYIVERTNDFMPSDSVLYGTAGQPVTAELMDTVSDLLRLTDQSVPDTCNRAAHRPRPADRPSPAARVAPKPTDIDASVEACTTPPLTLAQRLTIYTLSYTMILYVPPIGAFLLIYTALRDGMVTIT